ncbi:MULTISPECIES: LacI family DNA-binding transcriptional regulator [Mameliella]|jgi:DNA-binding LacI/PurR family transcriptional regulator|uniref:LacI family transcriptional regulator n=1 Tax=Mameliella alba TaxID=561184 RepID=A0A0B3SWJ8_9RHOB|nr:MULTISPECIES: LacI family DNA-binding transcriptional regulator [Mameliella]MBV6635839.1 LacI family DNA-binding transcriptional regulator [Mameliella sp.]MCR9272299.1 LacI family transcriptional regulator [Paracoccaceae bacterium]ODM46347.1 LacI family transcriptional regulator [Ruegeria sp. PBVC088]KHQ54809.1 LacI family transcriptional regulator [Mameliella alba]MDD9728453.1 LacI family DNA-binding transcriptional regulator [Mameliella sp. AT18]
MTGRKIRNMEEFAEVSGISRPTVSKYFNDPDSVRKSTRARIESALEQYDYRPNIFAINQNRKLTKNIGIVVPYLADPFFAEIARNLEMLVIAAGYHPILLSSHGSTAQENDNFESLRAIKPAGALLAPLGRASDKAAVERFCKAVPSVLFDSHISGMGEAFVGHDNIQATKLICEYLCRTGQPPAFFEMRTPTNPNAYRRRNAYCEAMERMGHPVHLLQAEGGGWDFEKIGLEGGTKVIEEHSLPTDTILCSNDRLAIGFLAAAYQKGLRVGLGAGAALRVAGHDDHPFSRYTCPPLTTVSQDYTAIAERSVERLFSLVESGERAENRDEIFFEGKLVMRQSA